MGEYDGLIFCQLPSSTLYFHPLGLEISVSTAAGVFEADNRSRKQVLFMSAAPGICVYINTFCEEVELGRMNEEGRGSTCEFVSGWRDLVRL